MSKYGNRKTTVFGQTFDSKHEAERYMELRSMEQQKKIFHLATQVPFELIPMQLDNKTGKIIEHPTRYIADFTYWVKDPDADGGFRYVVEDAKGVRTDVYRIKKKLMLLVHGIRVQEV